MPKTTSSRHSSEPTYFSRWSFSQENNIVLASEMGITRGIEVNEQNGGAMLTTKIELNKVELHSTGTAISLNGLSTGSNFVCLENNIEVENGYNTRGIALINGILSEIKENILNINDGHLYKGITVNNSERTTVGCNEINQNSSNLGTGIEIKDSDKGRINCNTLSNTQRGASFHGVSGNPIYGNTFISNGRGLTVANQAIIGKQSPTSDEDSDLKFSGNRWEGTFSDYAARHWITDIDILDEPQYVFRYNPESEPGNPYFADPSNPGWFVIDFSRDNFVCLDFNDSCNPLPLNTLSSFDDSDSKIADGTMETIYDSEVVLWNSRRKLYNKIQNYEAEIPVEFEEFLLFSEDNKTGGFEDFEQIIRNIFTVPVATQVEMQGLQTANTTLMEEYFFFTTAAEESSSTDSLHYMDKAADIRNDLETNLATLRDLAKIYFEQCEIALGSVSSTEISGEEIYQKFEQNFYEVFLQNTDNLELTTSNLETLEDIAKQCPETHGIGVYHARSLLEYHGDYVFEDTDCIRSERRNETAKNRSDNSFTVSPNPLQDFVEVNFTGPTKENAIIELINFTGKTILQEKMSSGLMQKRLNTEVLPVGIYFLRYIQNNRIFETTKVVKSH